jgi:outer membrane protein TolC
MILALLLSALTIDEAVQRALRNNPGVSVARASLLVAAAETAAARALPSPEFRVSTGSFDADPETVKERTTVGLRYSPPRPRELALVHAIAKAREQAAQSEIRVAEDRVASSVRLAFRRAVMAQNRAVVAARLVELRKDKRRTLLRQVSAGLKESDEKDLADLDVDEADNALRRAVALAKIEKRKLETLVEPTGTLDEDLAMDPDLLSVPVSFTADGELLERALNRRAELEVVQATCSEYELEQKLAKNERYPWISFVEVSHRVTYLPERGPWGWKFGVDLPFFRSAAAAEVKIAAAREARCRTQQKALATTIRIEVETAIANLEALRSELVDIDRLRSGPAERAFQRAQVALKAGRADHIDVFNAEARLLTIQDRWLERRLQYLDLESQLEAAVGGSLPSTRTN